MLGIAAGPFGGGVGCYGYGKICPGCGAARSRVRWTRVPTIDRTGLPARADHRLRELDLPPPPAITGRARRRRACAVAAVAAPAGHRPRRPRLVARMADPTRCRRRRPAVPQPAHPPCPDPQ